MTVWKSCHGVCNLEAFFFGGDLHGWWKLRALPTKTGGDFVSPPPKLVKISCLPTKTGILTCLTLIIRNPAGVRYGSWPLLPTPSKKTRPLNAASPVLVHDEVGFDRPSISHVLVCLIDFIQRIAVREDLARINLTVKDRLQQDFLVICCDGCGTAGKRDVSIERFCRIHLGAMRQTDATDEAAGTNDAECLVG